MTRRLISDISDQFTGFPLNSRDFAEAGRTSVIQLRDVSKERIDLSDLKQTDITIKNAEKFVRKGDVLFKSRGHVLEAHALTHDPETTIVTNGFIVLRPYATVMPNYLAWILNNINFDRVIQQTHIIKSVSLRDLMKMCVPVPDLATQLKVVTINQEIAAGRQLAQTYFDTAEDYLRGSVFKQ